MTILLTCLFYYCLKKQVGIGSAGSDEAANILYILHSCGAKRCPETSIKCPDGCNAKGKDNGIAPVQPEAAEQRSEIQQILASTSKSRNSLPNVIQTGLKLMKEEMSENPMPVDTSAEQKGASVMDALLGMFTSKIQAAAKKETSFVDKATSTQEDETDVIEIEDEEMTHQTSDPDLSETTTGRGRLLCLDGGGIRGLVLVQMLLEVESLGQIPIHHLFDWVSNK
jgi:calcium-independent phospholipase A2